MPKLEELLKDKEPFQLSILYIDSDNSTKELILRGESLKEAIDLFRTYESLVFRRDERECFDWINQFVKVKC